MNQKAIWFVIVIYKPDKEVLRRLITAIHEWPTEIVDNTDRNLGFGGGANVGMKKAFDAGGEWVVVCNQDIELTRAGVLKFTKELQECDPGIIGPEAGELDPKRWTTILSSTASRPGLEAGRMDSLTKRGNDKKKIGDDNLLYVSGSLMAIHRDVWEATGGFYEPYFMYYEDIDYCLRAKKAGFPLCQITVDGFKHTAHEDEYYLARNHLLFVLRNAPIGVKLYEFIRLPKTLLEFFL